MIRMILYRLLTPVRRVLLYPEKLIKLPGGMLRMSMAGGIALAVAVFLVALVISVFIVALNVDEDVPYLRMWRNRMPLVIILVVMIPIVTYYAVRLWLEGGVSAFEDIDRAWKAGLEEMERLGFDLRQIPIFLVLGTESEQQEQSLFNSARLHLTMEFFPRGASALRWFANENGIYLVLTDVGCLSKLAQMGHARFEAERTNKPRTDPEQVMRRRASITATISLDEDRELQNAVAVLRSSSEMEAPSFDDDRRGHEREPPPADIRGTMMLPQGQDLRSFVKQQLAPATKGVKLERAEVEMQSQRLKYLCRLLLAARRPLCPVNGVFTLLPYRMILAADWGASEVRKAAKEDVRTLSHYLELRCPVTAVVVGIEGEKGFQEFTRRLGRERSNYQRFGKGFDLWAVPTREQLAGLCADACSAFEIWIYDLFQQKGALEKTGNRALYSLLCRVRRYLRPRLEGILTDAYVPDSDRAVPVLFGGCYFAAAGELPEQQAFVRNVFDKLPEQQEDLEWSEAAVRRDRFYRRLAFAGFTIDGVLFLVIAGMVLRRLMS